VLQKTSFDPYGGRRSTAWNADLPATGLDALRAVQDSRGSRGFTDHEHQNRTGFVHMNGRVYDPRIGRFVSPDPIVQAPWFSQSYNRYAYVFGSPMSYTILLVTAAWVKVLVTLSSQCSDTGVA
jgi:RHS repeat-associated protein